jgi:hypothetical protein
VQDKAVEDVANVVAQKRAEDFGYNLATIRGQKQQRQALLLGIAIVERETGFEPATFCLGSRRSTN